MKTSVIFDCNGVFLSFEKSFAKRFQEDFQVPSAVFFPIYLEIMNNVRRPNAPKIYDLFKPCFDEWGISFTSEELMGYWFDSEIINHEMLDLLKILHSNGVRNFILSNNFSERHEYKLDFFLTLEKFCEATYYSWKSGFVKPHHDAFINVLSRHKISPDSCIFVDDSSINVAAGTEIGLECHLFQGVNQLKTFLNDRLLI